MAECESLAKTGILLCRQQGFGKPRGQLEVFGSGGECVLGQLDDRGIIRDLAFALPVTLRQPIVLRGGPLDFVVDQ